VKRAGANGRGFILRLWGYFSLEEKVPFHLKLSAPAYRQAGTVRGFAERYYHSYCAPLPRLSRYGGTGHVPVKGPK